MIGLLDNSVALGASMKAPSSASVHRPALTLSESQIVFLTAVWQPLAMFNDFQLCQRTGSFGSLYRPIRGSSCHSKTIMLTRGSLSLPDSSFMNFVRMKGSTEPPQDFRLYMPEHRCLFASSCFWMTISPQSRP